MKFTLGLFCLCSITFFGLGQELTQEAGVSPSVTYSLAEKSGNQRVWNRIETDSNGEQRVRKYVELDTGAYYWDGNQWLDSDENLEIRPVGAVAVHGQVRAIFAPDINSEGAIDYEAPDGTRFQSHVLGIGYYDTATGQSIMVGSITNSIGQLVPPNVVIYPNCFDGDGIAGSLRYTYRKTGIEQDVIITGIAAPSEYGLNDQSSLLQVFTEFLDPRQPEKSRRIPMEVPESDQKALSADMAWFDSDESLDFGSLIFGEGRAFQIGNSAQDGSASVRKSWQVIENRNVLIESVDYAAVRAQLEQQPPLALKGRGKTKAMLAQSADPQKGRRLFAGVLPKRPNKRLIERPIQIAAVKPTSGLVIDYSATLVNATNFTFQGNYTYLVNSAVTLSKTTTIEGGTVIKFTNSTSKITTAGDIDCQTGPYSMAVFTAIDDNTIGDTLAGSTGSPSGYYGSSALEMNISNSRLKYLRFSYMNKGIRENGTGGKLSHSQFVKCQTALEIRNQNYRLYNSLFNSVGTMVTGITYKVYGEHVTVNECNLFATNSTGTAGMYFTNSLWVAITNLGGVPYYTNFVASLASGTGVFETVGAGKHYLAPGSPYRNLGTTNISARLLAALKTKTTYSPAILTNAVVFDTTLYPAVQRDVDIPDYGYHYDSIDYAVSWMTVTNATLTLTNGVVIAGFNGTAVWLQNGGTVISEGTPDAPNRVTRYYNVQEQPTLWGIYGPGSAVSFYSSHSGSPAPAASFRFTHFHGMCNGGNDLYSSTSLSCSSITARDCLFQRSLDRFSGLSTTTIILQNNIFEEVDPYFGQVSEHTTVNAYNNLFKKGNITFYKGSNAWTFKDNAFDGCAITDFNGLTHSNNGYLNGATRLTPTNANDVVVASFSYLSGPLGKYYQATNSALLDMGSRSPTNAGLFQHTAVVSQTKDTNATVDIGFHYVAFNVVTNNPLSVDTVWVEDYAPAPTANMSPASSQWNWITTSPYSGSKALQQTTNASTHQNYFTGATNTITVNEDDTLVAYIKLTSGQLPSEVMLQWNDDFGAWERRAYWGTDSTGFGTDGTVTRRYMGAVPSPAGQWLRLEIPATQLALDDDVVTGLAFTLYGGTATWDYVAKSAPFKPLAMADYDADGIPDYFEDTTGNGVFDTTGDASDWAAYTSGFGISAGIPGLQVFTPLK